MTPGLALRCISEYAELEALAPQWSQLWERSGATPFQRPEWLLSWLEAFRPSELSVVEGRIGDRLVGLAPMFIYPRQDQRVLAPIGAGITDYLDWVVDPAVAEQFVPAAFAELQMADWDVMEIMDLSMQSPLLSWLRVVKEPCDTCPGLQIAPGADFADVVHSRQRRNLSNARNRASRAGSWNFEVATAQTLPEFLNTLFRLHRARWTEQGEPGVLSDARVKDFHTRSAPRLLACGALRFYGMRFEGRLIAVLYALVGARRAYCYLQGFDPAFAEFSPGMLILEAAVRDAIQANRLVVDFLRGREPYKYKWGAQDEATFRLRAEHPAAVSEAMRQPAA